MMMTTSAAALVLLLGAAPAHGQVTDFPMNNANIRVAVRECAVESRVASSVDDCSQAGSGRCDATFDCPFSQESYGLIETWDTALVTCFALDASNACSTTSNGQYWNDGLFARMTGFNRPIGAWNTSAVTIFTGMFYIAPAFNQPLDSWNVGAGTEFYKMFREAVGFDQDLTGWTPSTALTTTSEMFLRSAVSSDVRDASGDPWGITGVDTSDMYTFSCLDDVANGVDPATYGDAPSATNGWAGGWSCLPTAPTPTPAPAPPAPAAAGSSGPARVELVALLALVALLFG